jgi:hypothetical protein
MRKIALYAMLGLVASVLAVTGASDVKAAGTAPHQIHISGVLPGTVTFVILPFSDIQDPYYQVGALGVASGQLKSLGNSNVFTFHRPVPAASATEPPTIKDGNFFIVAANGDRINGLYQGIVMPGTDPNQLVPSADWVITGGTGRFEDATGTIHATGHVTVPEDPYALEWSLTWVLDGTVNY